MTEVKLVEASSKCFSSNFWKMEAIHGRSSTERFVHFNCGHCEKWFSIADAPIDRVKWTCPWCSKSQIFDSILPEDVEKVKQEKIDV